VILVKASRAEAFEEIANAISAELKSKVEETEEVGG
jgi:hypothetical protein